MVAAADRADALGCAGEEQIAWHEGRARVEEAELEGERLLLEQLSRQAQAQPGGQSVSALSWLFVVVPEAGQCESLQAGLEELSALSESLAVSE